jgi:site-specific DNA recombinase
MKLAALYARSSKDRHDVSVDSQVTELKARAKADGYIISAEFNDKALSGKDDDRPGFQEMIQAASSDEAEWSRLYVYDTARFSRVVLHSAIYEDNLKKNGIEIVYLQIPEESDEANKELMKQVFRGINIWHSLNSRSGAIRGMKENIRKGFRSGGVAPYGYALKYEDTGAVREGKPVMKSRLVINPKTSVVVTEYLERRAKGEGRKTIAMDFNGRGISAPRGGLWSSSTLRSFEDNIMVYLGHTAWGRDGERVDGKFINGRWKEQVEWEVNENTHEAIISNDVADAVIKQRQKRSSGALKPSNYLLTGTLFCSSCGGLYTGNRGYYRCAGGDKYGHDYCDNGQVSQEALEREIQRAIKDYVLVPEFTKECIKSARHHLRVKPESKDNISNLEKKFVKIENSIQRWMSVFESEGKGWDRAIERMQVLEAEKEEVEVKLASLRVSSQVVPLTADISDEFLEGLLDRFEETMSLGDMVDRKALLGEVVAKIEIGPKIKESRCRELTLETSHFPLISGDPKGI